MRAFVSINDPLQRRLADDILAAGGELACIEAVHLDVEALSAAYPSSLVVGGYSGLLNPHWDRPGPAADAFEDSALIAEHYATLMHLMGRLVCHDQKTQIDKDEFLRRILLNIRWLITQCRLDTAIFWNEPHQVSHYLLYRLLKNQGGRIFIVQKTALPDHYCLIEEIGGQPLRNTLPDTARAKIAEAVSGNIAEKTGAAQVLDSRVSKKLARVSKRSSLRPPYNIMLQSARRRWKSRSSRSRRRSAERRALDEAAAQGTWTQIFRSWRNFAAYRRVAATALPAESSASKPRVFMSLQCQPERQTAPASFPFYNQIAVLQLVAQHAGEVWVKEHPSQFAPYQRNYLGRSVGFYDAIAKLGNVTLLHHGLDTFKAIDRCDAVAVLAGTVGWEAVLRDKPTFVFGAPWFIHAPAPNLIQVGGDDDLVKLRNGAVEIGDSTDRAAKLCTWCAEVMAPVPSKLEPSGPEHDTTAIVSMMFRPGSE